jgi:hypothetical protein
MAKLETAVLTEEKVFLDYFKRVVVLLSHCHVTHVSGTILSDSLHVDRVKKSNLT